jgi:outer membrane protein OmpU
MELSGVDLGVALGYQSASFFPAGSAPGNGARDGDIRGVSMDAKFANGFRVTAAYRRADVNATYRRHEAIGVSYTKDALTLAANYGKSSSNAAVLDGSGYGVAVDYDPGGGAVVQAGYGHSNPSVGAGFDSWSLGLALSF